MNYFTFDGIDSRTYNTYIATSNAFDAPGREDEVIKVPGSNNIYYLTEGTYKPFDIKLYCYIPSNMQVKTDDLRNYLLSKGTCRYTEAIRPNEFRVARFIEAYELDVSDRVSTAFVLTFKAQPQRYLTTNTPITTTATADTTTDTTMSLTTVPTPINISLNGNTTQEGSSGKNLFDYTTVTNTGVVDDSGTTGTYQTRLWSAKIGVTPSTTYTFKTTAYSSNNERIYINRLIYYGQNGSFLRRDATYNTLSEATFTTPNDAYYLVIDLRTQRLTTNLTNTLLKGNTQFEKGSTATAYEPHISPTNPQPIHNVSGDNIVNVTGFNLWDEQWELGYYGLNGAKRNSPNCIRSVNAINVLPNTAYYLCYTNSRGVSMSLRFYDKYNNFISNGGQPSYPKGIITTPNNASYMRFYMADTYGTTYKHDICINVSDTQKNGTYEPYTAQSYPLYLPVENYFDLNTVYADTQYFTIDGDSVTSNYFAPTKCYIPSRLVGKKCIFQAYIYSNPTTVNMRVRANVNGTNTDGNYIRYGEEGISSVSFTPTSTSDYVHITYSDAGGMVTVKNIMLSEGNLNHYTPYGTTPIELNKIGTYQDYIYKNGGKWYVHKETASVDMGTLTYQTDNGGVYFYSSVSGKGRTNFDLLCTCYTVTTSTNTSGMTDYQVKGQTSGSYIFIKDSRYTSPTGLKTALSGETLKYNLATATNTEITDTTLINQLNDIEKAYSYNGTTNILQVSNDNGFMLEVVSLHSNNVSSNYKGEPIITVNSTGLIYFNGCVIKVNQAPMTINSQTMQAYNGTVNLNNYIEANDFPMIEPGNNVIGSEMPLSIVPNYWKL